MLTKDTDTSTMGKSEKVQGKRKFLVKMAVQLSSGESY